MNTETKKRKDLFRLVSSLSEEGIEKVWSYASYVRDKDEEPSLTSDEEACLAEALEDVKTGRVYSFEDAERDLFPNGVRGERDEDAGGHAAVCDDAPVAPAVQRFDFPGKGTLPYIALSATITSCPGSSK